MDSEHVVEVDVQGFAVEGMVAVDGSRLSADEASKANDEKLAAFDNDTMVDLVDSLVREDGSGILYFRWDPPAEAETEGAALTWHSAKLYTEHVLSSVAGAGLLRVGHRIGTRATEVVASDEAE